MKQKIQISIPEPCHKGWQNMTPVEKGRFCASCQKTVLDFTYLSDNEIINLVNKNETLCGRINVSQLNRNLIETKIKSNYFGYFATTVLAFFGLGTENVVAQEKPVVVQTDLKYLNKATDSVKKFTVNGYVIMDSKPFEGVNIITMNSKIGVISDSLGKYSIEVNIGDVLEFSFLDVETRRIQIVDNRKVYNVTMAPIVKELHMVGLVRKRTFFGRTFRKIGNWFR
jgi:hypothetical protein